MHFLSLQSIDAPDPLAQLFNEYFEGLSTLAIMAEPTYVTMYDVSSLYDQRGTARQRNHLRRQARRFFELTVLHNSLSSLHAHVGKAIALLEGFFADYGDDLRGYAIANRLRTIDEYGSDDPTDWYRDNEADESEPWKITPKDDLESLRHYTLHHELSYHFAEHDTRGEFIGSSQAADFYPYTALVTQQSAFSWRRMFEAVAGQQVEVVRLAEDGTSTPMSLGDHLEEELNTDLRSEALVARFNLALTACGEIYQFYARLPDDAIEGYHLLLDVLRRIRDLDFPPEAVAELLA